LVSNVGKSEERLNEQRQRFMGPEDHDLREVYGILLNKFKRLKKTKEEMTKYCMRNVFKLLSEKIKDNPAWAKGPMWAQALFPELNKRRQLHHPLQVVGGHLGKIRTRRP
jgi:hypothetical protein